MEDSVIRIKPFHYVHILDNNTNLTQVIEGPITYILKDHEKLALGKKSLEMIKIPPRHYCVVANPAVKNAEGELELDSYGMVKVKFGEREVRTAETHPNPFPLYPFEAIDVKTTKIPVVPPNAAIMLRALRDFTDENQKQRKAGDEWLHKGPCSFIPKVECEIVVKVSPITIKPNTALKLRAKRSTKDCYGNSREAGEEWLIRECGDYLPEVEEEVVETIKAIVLTEKKAVQLRGLKNFTDVYGKERKAGEEWLVNLEMSDTHIPDVNEEVVGYVNAVVLNNRQYAVILNPVDKTTGRNLYGKKELRVGEKTFFLKPRESLQNGIQDIFVLSEDEALLLKAVEDFTDSSEETHKAGERWMIYGPCDYIPPIEVEIIETRKTIPLDENEGIYVRDTKTGEVKAVSGESYMLKPHEELWEMELSSDVEELVARQMTGETFQIAQSEKGDIKYMSSGKPYQRDKTRVVSFRVPHNSAVQVYDYKKKESRVVFGPDRIMLEPDESFTVLNLSGGKPKKENQIKNLALILGPDFMSDVVIVETSDHASLALSLSYNWYFSVDKSDPESVNRIFQVKDFVGDACKTIASRVRGAVSAYTFEEFHQNSSEIIKASVFGKRIKDPKPEIKFEANGLVVSNVDIQSVEPTDEKTKESLKKSVTQAIEITIEANKARAEYEAKKADEHNKGEIELQGVRDMIDAEQESIKLIQLKAKNKEVQLAGEMTSKAQAESKAKKIQLESKVQETEFEEQAKKIKNEAELNYIRSTNEANVAKKKSLDELEINKARQLAKIETEKFQQVVEAVGRETIIAMAKAGPEMQARMMKGLGLKGFMIMDSKNPVNLFSTANGFLPQK